jgi:hypothetical protein
MSATSKRPVDTATGLHKSRCLDVHAYVKLLDKTIDKILEREHAEEGK